MNFYNKKTLWKWFLVIGALFIVCASLWFSNFLVKEIAIEERKKVNIWANAIKQKAELVNYTEIFFKKIEEEERKRIEIWTEATKRIVNADISEDVNFYARIISQNTTIPVILTDEELNIIAVKNVEFPKDSVSKLEGKIYKDFSIYSPIVISYGTITNYLFYKESILYTDLKKVLNDLTESFFSEVVINTASMPVVVVDSTLKNVYYYDNIDTTTIGDSIKLKDMLNDMDDENTPIEINFEGQGKKYIYYQDSYILTQLKIFPYIQFLVIGIFIFLAYILFNISNRSEQNKVWVGMAKETAHQLGTPISSILAWIDFIPQTDENKLYIEELRKDVYRLNNISERFSKIGSKPELTPNYIDDVIRESVAYIKARSSQKVNFNIEVPTSEDYKVKLNKNLIGWTFENIMKNAIDAMDGEGSLEIILLNDNKNIIIDITDTGKGMNKSQFKAVFKPGYTTKTRGWGLGLTLSKRIIEEYHKGKIFVKSSVIGKGTTFRIILPK